MIGALLGGKTTQNTLLRIGPLGLCGATTAANFSGFVTALSGIAAVEWIHFKLLEHRWSRTESQRLTQQPVE